MTTLLSLVEINQHNLRIFNIVIFHRNVRRQPKRRKGPQTKRRKSAKTNETFNCDRCLYKTNVRYRLMVHSKTSPCKMLYRCEHCPYKVKHKINMSFHLLSHRKISNEVDEMVMYKCDRCRYETKTKRGLKMHQKIHRKFTEVSSDKC